MNMHFVSCIDERARGFDGRVKNVTWIPEEHVFRADCYGGKVYESDDGYVWKKTGKTFPANAKVETKIGDVEIYGECKYGDGFCRIDMNRNGHVFELDDDDLPWEATEWREFSAVAYSPELDTYVVGHSKGIIYTEED